MYAKDDGRYISTMKTIHISQFYPCSEVKLAVELQYIVELGKYLWSNDCCLSVDGVDFDKILRKSKYWDYFRVAIDLGWVIDCSEEDYEITSINPVDYSVSFKNTFLLEEEVKYDVKDSRQRNEDYGYAYRTPVKKQVVFAEKNNQFWSWKLDANYIVNNITMCSSGSETTWVSLVAYVAVQRLLFGYPQNLLIEISYPITRVPMLLSNFLLLLEECDVCKGWCFYTFTENVDESTINYLGYVAWYAKGVEQGELKRWYSPTEKQKYFSDLGFGIGDVVYLYERKKGQKLDYVKEISGFHVAIIEEVTEKYIRFTVVNNKKTKAQGEMDYRNFSMATKQMYDYNNPYNKANVSTRTLDWTDIGIEYCMFDEYFFITRCNNDDIRECYVQGEGWSSLLLKLPAIELTYWILKDYEIPFDEDKFIEKYMTAEPLYDMYHRLGTVDEKYIKKQTR